MKTLFNIGLLLIGVGFIIFPTTVIASQTEGVIHFYEQDSEPPATPTESSEKPAISEQPVNSKDNQAVDKIKRGPLAQLNETTNYLLVLCGIVFLIFAIYSFKKE